MNYQETVNYLFASTPVFEKVGAKAYKPELQTTNMLDEHFGHPHLRYKTIHVAGTNGKGSCSHTLAAILQAQGYKVGLFTSPHLVDFRERIRVDGKCMPEQYVIDFVEENRDFFEPLHPSFFELTTILAFKYFAEQQVDYAVIEVGLGGRLDSTNIITPILSVITNISLDHTQFLGDTLEKIASEKAGIIKPGVPAVVGEWNKHTKPVFESKAASTGAPLFGPDDLGNIDLPKADFELKGRYQQKNQLTILHAVKILKDSCQVVISDKAVGSGFAHVCELTGLRGRWEKLGEHPLVICDTGHNLAGWQYLEPQIQAVPAKRKHIVFGMVDDKDIEHVLELLEKLPRDTTSFYWTQASTHRAIPVAELNEKALRHGLNGKCYPSVAQAFNAARKLANLDDFIFVGGSSYVVADLLTDVF